MKHPLYTQTEVSSADAQTVTGGAFRPVKLQPSVPYHPVKPVDPPVYITLAIGEGGGDLPVITQ